MSLPPNWALEPARAWHGGTAAVCRLRGRIMVIVMGETDSEAIARANECHARLMDEAEWNERQR